MPKKPYVFSPQALRKLSSVPQAQTKTEDVTLKASKSNFLNRLHQKNLRNPQCSQNAVFAKIEGGQLGCFKKIQKSPIVPKNPKTGPSGLSSTFASINKNFSKKVSQSRKTQKRVSMPKNSKNQTF